MLSIRLNVCMYEGVLITLCIIIDCQTVFPKAMHMLTMIINEQQTMPYYLSDELASEPYNHNLR
jgi:hypothetical protein